MIQAKRDKLNIKKLNPPGIFKKNKGKRDFGEKYNSKYYPDNYKNDVLYMNYDDLLDNLYMENKGIDFGLRCYKNYNNKNKENRVKKAYKDKKLLNNDDKSNNQINKEDDDELMKRYVNNQFTFKQNNENNLDLKNDININQDMNLELNNNINNQDEYLENKNTEQIIINKKDENYQKEPVIIEQNNNIEKNNGYEDIRLNYVMSKLGLEAIIPIFEQYHMSFNDILFLTKDDLNELGLKIYQKNRLISFIEEYSSKAKNYTLEEIQTFFEENKIYNISEIQE